MFRSLKAKLYRVCWTSKRRKIITMVSTVSLVAATAAIAYWSLSAIGTSSQTQPLGSAATQALDVTVSGLPAGMKPGDTANVTVTATNPVGSPVVISGVDYALTADGSPDTADFTLTPRSVGQ